MPKRLLNKAKIGSETSVSPGSAPPAAGRLRQLTPLITVMGVVAFIAVTVLPSSLNLPQANPTTVLEYAPVPPDDSTPPPFSSGASSLSAAGSSSLTTAVGKPPEIPKVTDKKDIPPLDAQRKCVRGRQTEDPSSPPCQQYFKGDNGGATWQGVTKDEIIVLLYNQVGTITDRNSGKREATPPAGTYCDIDLMDCNGDGKNTGARNENHAYHRAANAYSRYFNARYQTYDRRVHFWYYWSGSDSASTRRGDAADNWDRLKPFAVINQTWWGGFDEEYADSMAFRDVVVFAGRQGALSRTFFQKYAPQVFSYWPDIENWSDLYVGLICNKVKGTPVTDAGPEYAGKERVYGLMWTTDPGFDNLRQFKNQVKTGLSQCGITPKTEVQFPGAAFAVDNSQTPEYATTNVATLRDAGVNTVLWLGGVDTKTTQAAGSRGYLPQWILAGDQEIDGWDIGRLNDQNAFRHAWVMSYTLRQDKSQESPAYQAFKEAAPDSDDWGFALQFYRDMFMLFQSIQVAGPKLSPESMDAGLHAIQRKDSTSPYVAACYFFPGDYSCVKDAHEQWWDPDATDTQDGGKGCYRQVRGGQRYARDKWPEARGSGIDIPGYENKSDPCNGFNGGFSARLA